MSNQPQKPGGQFPMMVAFFITFMIVYFHFMAPPPKERDEEAPLRREPEAAEPFREAPTTTTPATGDGVPLPPDVTQEPTDAGEPVVPVHAIRVATAAYEAEFTTRGAGLRRYRLKEFHRTAERPAGEGDRLVLLDELAPGHVSLVIRNLDTGRVRMRIRDLEYRLVSAPDFATLDPDVEVNRNPDGQLVFRAHTGVWEIEKTYTLPVDAPPEDAVGAAYGFQMRLQFRNLTNTPQTLAYDIVGPAGIVPDDAGRFATLQGVSAFLKGGGEIGSQTSAIVSLSGERLIEHNNLRTRWVGLSNRFFSAVLLADPSATIAAGFERIDEFTPRHLLAHSPYPPEAEAWLETVLTANEVQGDSLLSMDRVEVAPGATLGHAFAFYAGPSSDMAPSFDPSLEPLLHYQWAFLQPISNFLLTILELVQGVVGNYGIAIILLTILVKMCLHPLTRKALSSGHKMQKIQPLLQEIRRKYADDKMKQQQETMALFKEHGVNPVGGCLPMLLQMPIFFALYGVFSRSFPIRQASFIPGWIDDLSQPDHLFGLPFTIPILSSNSFNLLPIIYLVLQLLHMGMQPKSPDPQVQQQQKMMRLMPIFFVFIFYSMPSGLVLYFVIQTLFTLLEHWMIKIRLDTERDDAVADSSGSTRFTPAQAGAGVGVGAGTGVGAGRSGGGKKKKKKK